MTRNLDNADRLVLTSSLVPFLRARDGVASIAEAADHFDVPEAEIERAVRLIACSGAPGETGCYLDSDLFDIDWDALERDREIAVTRFVALEHAPAMSADEVSAVLAGLQILRRLPGVGGALEERIDGLVGLLRGGPAIVGASPPQAEAGGFETVREAVRSGRRLAFVYRSPVSDEAEREVDPISLDAEGDAWYLRGWCLSRDAPRSFRLDRMRAPRLLGPAEPHEEAAPGSAQGPVFRPAEDAMRVLLELEPGALPLLQGFLDEGAVPQSREDGLVLMELRIAHPAPLVRVVAGAAGRMRVLEPEAVRRAVADWARAALDGA